MSEYIEAATEIAEEVAEIQKEGFGKVSRVELKGAFDIVTEIDRRCEKVIYDFLRQKFSTHDILAEEGGRRKSGSEWRWLVDPLDGTVNYLHGYPFFGVSLALEYRSEIVAGVVLETNRGELFVAEAGSGATLNGAKIVVSQTDQLRDSLLNTGFVVQQMNEKERQDNLAQFDQFTLKTQGVRRDGAAAIDFGYVAAGRYDGCWKRYLKPWDLAAGSLIVREAGGRVTDFDGVPLKVDSPTALFSNGLIHDQMLEVLQTGQP